MSENSRSEMGNVIDSRVMQAHAKVNLFLRVLAREASGYHAIETLFQRLELHDVVRVEVQTDAGARSLDCSGPAMPAAGLGAMHQNLAWKAAEAYVAASGWSVGWHIAIEKRIPVGGGLGGGSSNAAAVLRAFESMSPNKLGEQRLLEIAGTLGADVPFFVSDVSLALAWGRGDRMLVLPPLPVSGVCLYTFAEGVNTAAAYSAIAAARERAGRIATVSSRVYDASAFASWASVSELATNDFEDVVMQMHPGVAGVLPVLKADAAADRARGVAVIGMLSGSGATCFTLGDASSLASTYHTNASIVRSSTTA